MRVAMLLPEGMAVGLQLPSVEQDAVAAVLRRVLLEWNSSRKEFAAGARRRFLKSCRQSELQVEKVGVSFKSENSDPDLEVLVRSVRVLQGQLHKKKCPLQTRLGTRLGCVRRGTSTTGRGGN